MDTPATPAASTLAVPVAMLTRYVADIFAAGGCERAEAECISTHLVSANLAGHDSHGVQRVAGYVNWLREGYVRPGQRITVTHETPTQAVVDGNYGFGQSIGEQAVDLGIAKAQAAGMAAIALRHSGHIGRIGDWAERAAAAGLVSIHFVNVAHGELVAPFGGVDRRFSTNPVCIGAPTPDGPPMILDFATSLVAEGKVAVASYGGKKLPEGALIRPDGQLSTDPETLYGPLAGTHLRNPAGGEGAIRAFGEHKGSGLAIMCEVLAGCLTGGETSGPIPGGKRGRISNGMLSIYLKPASFGAEGFREAVAEYAAYVKASRPATPGAEVLVPGEPELRSRAARMRDGVPLTAATWEAIVKTGAGFGLAAPM